LVFCAVWVVNVHFPPFTFLLLSVLIAMKNLKTVIKIQNVVLTGKLNCKVVLEALYGRIKGLRWASRFKCLILRLRGSKATVSIFSSGRLVCTGESSILKAENALRRLVEDLKRVEAIPYDAELYFEVENIVATVTVLHVQIDIESLTSTFQNVTYLPEQFPAAKFRSQNSKVTFLIFSTGRVTCAGAKSVKELIMGVKGLLRMLESSGLIKEF